MKSIRVGIIGAGWGQLQIEAFKRSRGLQVTALCDVDAARAKEIARKHNLDRVYVDYHDLIACEQVDLVSIATPPAFHPPMVRAALEMDKAVLVEKPLALNEGDARDLLRLAESRHAVHAVDLQMRFLPALAYAKELIEEQYLGQLFRVDVTMIAEHPWGEHGKWAAEDAAGGGVLMELGTHFIDALLWLFGPVDAVLAERRTHFRTARGAKSKSKGVAQIPMSVTGDDAFWSIMRFAGGGDALLNFVTGARHDPGWTISAYGSVGSLVIQSGSLLGMRDGDREMAILPIPKRLELGNDPQDPLMWGMTKLGELLAAKLRRDHDVLPYPDFRDGVAVAKVVDAVRQSSVEHGWVNLGLKLAASPVLA